MSAYVLVIAPRVPTTHTCLITVDINVCACAQGCTVCYGARALPKINALSPNVFPSLIFSVGLLLNIIITCKHANPDGRPYSAHRASSLSSQTGHLSRAKGARLLAQHGCGVRRAGVRAVRIRTTYSERRATRSAQWQEPMRHLKEHPIVRARDGMERTSPWIKMYIACAISPSR